MRFKVGEMAIVAVDISGNGCEGAMVEILRVGPFTAENRDGELKTYDYETSSPKQNWKRAFCWDIELRKIDPPAEPASITRQEETTA